MLKSYTLKKEIFGALNFLTAFQFRRFFNNLWIPRHFNFAVQPKYYIWWHFNLTVWPKHCNLRHFSFVVVLKIEFFKCVSLQHFRNFRKSIEPKCKLKNILYISYTLLIHKSIISHSQQPSRAKNSMIIKTEFRLVIKID